MDKLYTAMDKVEAKLDRIAERLNSIDVTLASQHESLKIHIKRTNLLEEKLAPVEKHVAMVHGALKLIGLVAMLAAIGESIVIILGRSIK